MRTGQFFLLFADDVLLRQGAGGDERHVLKDEGRGVEPVPALPRAGRLADGVFGVQDELIQGRELRLRRDGFVDDAEFEGADRGRAVDRIFLLLHRQLAAGQHVLHDLPQIDVDALRALEAEVQPDAEDAVGAVGLQVVGHGLGFV